MRKANARIRIICPFCGPTFWMEARVPSKKFLDILVKMLEDVKIPGTIEKTLADYLEVEYRGGE